MLVVLIIITSFCRHKENHRGFPCGFQVRCFYSIASRGRAITTCGLGSAIHLIMATDVEQDDLLFGHHDSQGDAIGIGKPYGVAPGQLAREWMQSKARLKRVTLKRLKDSNKAGS